MPSRRQILAGAGGVAAAALLGTRVRGADAKTVRIGYLKGLTPLNISRLRGTLVTALAAGGYTLQWSGPFPAFAPAVEALTPGSIDITEGSATSASSAMVAGAPFKIFAYALPSADGEGVIVRPDSGITSVPQLVGKRVAVNRGGSGNTCSRWPSPNTGFRTTASSACISVRPMRRTRSRRVRS
jgi:sulfonate transport system substrate-binding protein